MAQFDVEQLFGTRFAIEFPSTDPENPIRFWVEPPSDPLNAYLTAITGMADTAVNDEGKAELAGSSGLLLYEKFKVAVATHCIVGAENLDGWPDDCRKSQASGWPALNDAAMEAINPNVRQYLFGVIGQKILDKQEVTEDQGNASEQQPTGSTTENSGNSDPVE